MKSTAEDCKNPNLQSQIRSFTNVLLIFHFLVLFCALIPTLKTLLVILMAIGNTRYIFHRIINPFPFNCACYILLWDLEFSWNFGKKWVPTYTTVVAYLTTIAQTFIFRKLLAIIPSMDNDSNLIILNQKIHTNTKSPMLLTQLVL